MKVIDNINDIHFIIVQQSVFMKIVLRIYVSSMTVNNNNDIIDEYMDTNNEYINWLKYKIFICD